MYKAVFQLDLGQFLYRQQGHNKKAKRPVLFF
ncbi:hypothetical protein N481_13425 [Pseudoalteromonas luteoviolacea S4047-1]|uniref:Uncharacterized protein n=1 Tax=Pseudoalteromonas luteoviolacea S4054 TaxID=1129367 RepID=A0A0F6AIA4_9GAMM|nr:hypothetical protein N479_04405 [Pseudoalteromonas luteoviolacea S4054]KZN73048.1 hypothetical protein N481_13425 [Pseudoalteromonas luteoviolacea S4047-1]